MMNLRSGLRSQFPLCEQNIHLSANIHAGWMSGSDYLAVTVNYVSSRHTTHPKRNRGFGVPTTILGPDVERVSPTALVHMFAHGFQSIVNAQWNDGDFVLPIGVVLPKCLQACHRLLTGPTPCCPEVQHHNFAAQIGELHVFFAVEGNKFDFGNG